MHLTFLMFLALLNRKQMKCQILKSCQNEAESGKKGCQFHLYINNERKKKHRKNRRDNQLCTVCGVKTESKNWKCKICEKIQWIKKEERQKKKQEKGICIQCNLPAKPGRISCEYHLDYNNKAVKKCKQKKLEANHGVHQ